MAVADTIQYLASQYGSPAADTGGIQQSYSSDSAASMDAALNPACTSFVLICISSLFVYFPYCRLS